MEDRARQIAFRLFDLPRDMSRSTTLRSSTSPRSSRSRRPRRPRDVRGRPASMRATRRSHQRENGERRQAGHLGGRQDPVTMLPVRTPT